MDQVTLRAYAAHASEIARRHASARSAEGGVPRYFARAFAPNGRILDIGAGAGFDLAFLVSEGHQAYGMEPVAEMRADRKVVTYKPALLRANTQSFSH